MNRALFLVLLPGLFSLVGCGGGADAGRQPVFPVTGTVTMFGAPLADATVAFAPQNKQPTAIGKTNAQGEFKLTSYEYGDGAAEGNFKVIISKAAPSTKSSAASSGGGGDHEAAEVAAGAHEAAGSGGGAKGAAQLVPPKYTSSADTPFSAVVKADGENNFTFDIQ